MGTWHFLSMGESPGAVTSALAYIKRQYEQNNVAFFGSDSNREKVKKVSGIILFTTPEIRNGNRPPKERECIDNKYGSSIGREISYGKGVKSAFDLVCEFISDEFGTMLQEERGKVYWLEASYHDLDFDLRQVIKAFFALSPPGQTGKEVWVNLTGGSNPMNIACLLATALSGITGRAYYTYTQNTQLMRPADEQDFWYEVPIIKVNFDKDYEVILQVLSDCGDWLESEKLLNLTKQKRWEFQPNDFARDYLNKLDGWLIERNGSQNRLKQPGGQRFLELINDGFIRALIYKEPSNNVLEVIDVCKEVRL